MKAERGSIISHFLLFCVNSQLKLFEQNLALFWFCQNPFFGILKKVVQTCENNIKFIVELKGRLRFFQLLSESDSFHVIVVQIEMSSWLKKTGGFTYRFWSRSSRWRSLTAA